MADITTYTLMNKNTPVLTGTYDGKEHRFQEIIQQHDMVYAPLGIFADDGSKEFSLAALNIWWHGRSLPASTIRFLETRNMLPISIQELKEKNFGLSLSDQYWVNDMDNPKTWSEVNYFHNDFSDDIGKLLIGEMTKDEVRDKPVNIKSPNATVDGVLRKKWKIVDGKRCLFKGGNEGHLYQEPLNEVVATKLYELLLDKDEYVPYWNTTIKDEDYSVCVCMIQDNEEIITAAALNDYFPAYLEQDEYMKTVDNYWRLDLLKGNIERFFAKMFVCDAIMANVDRHTNNFGVIRNVESLEFTRIAPLWDNGYSLYCDHLGRIPDDPWDFRAQPYAEDMRIQLSYIDDFSWYDPGKLESFPTIAHDVLAQAKEEKIGENGRLDKITEHLGKRISYVDGLAREWQLEHNRDHIYVPERPSSLKTRGKAFATAERIQAGMEASRDTQLTDRDGQER